MLQCLVVFMSSKLFGNITECFQALSVPVKNFYGCGFNMPFTLSRN